MKIVIIGAVAAGMSAAAKLSRTTKAEITVLEKGDEVSLGACGLPFYVSGDVKKPKDLIAREADEFRKTGIDLREFTEATKVDTEKKKVKALNLKTGIEEEFEYDKLIIASGARGLFFPPLDISANNFLGARSLKDAVKTKEMLSSGNIKTVAIIGGGFIGIEMAEACRAYKGIRTIIVQKNEVLLSQFDREFSVDIEETLIEKGVEIYAPATVSEAEVSDGNITQLTIEKDGKLINIKVDLVINATGVRPETGFIDGVEKLENGAIKVDENMRTSLPDVFAAGDCSVMKAYITGEYQYAPLGTNANKQGRIIADYIKGVEGKNFKFLGSFAINIFDKSAAAVGLTEQQAKKQGFKYKTNTIESYDKAGFIKQDIIKIKLVYGAEDGRILGAQLIGKGVVAHRCNYYAIAIANNMTTAEFGMIDLGYSPPFGGVWDPTLIAANTSK